MNPGKVLQILSSESYKFFRLQQVFAEMALQITERLTLIPLFPENYIFQRALMDFLPLLP